MAACYLCHGSCKECVGGASTQCLTCSSPTNYVARAMSGSGYPNEWGTCTLKSGSNSVFTVIVDNKATPQYTRNLYQSTTTNIYGMSTTYPMNNLIDGISKAYELGAACISAKITIQIYDSAKSAVHSMRRVDETVKTPEIRYIPSKWDPS